MDVRFCRECILDHEQHPPLTVQMCLGALAVVDSMLEGATPDRAFVQRLIELAAGRITIDEYKSQVLKAIDADHAAGNTIASVTP